MWGATCLCLFEDISDKKTFYIFNKTFPFNFVKVFHPLVVLTEQELWCIKYKIITYTSFDCIESSEGQVKMC